MIAIAFLLIVSSSSVSCLSWNNLIYDESYILDRLDDRFPYLKVEGNGTRVDYIGPRDYFNFSHVYEPTDEYLEKTDIETVLYDELRAMEIGSSIATMDQWHYSDSDALLESGAPYANRKLCKRDLDFIEQELRPVKKNGTEDSYDHIFAKGSHQIQLARYMDSWGRPPSETYHGHSYWVGSYRGCLMASLKQAHSREKMKFHYCWGKLRLKSWPEKDEMIPPTNFRVGFCLPRTCDTRLANLHRSQLTRIMGFNMAPAHRARFNNLIDVYCLPNRASGPSREARWFVIAIKCWSALILFVTMLDSLSPIRGSLPKSLLDALSLRKNFKRFLSDDPPPIVMISPDTSHISRQPIDLRSLGVIRFFGSLGVVLGHLICSLGWVQNTTRFPMVEYKTLTYQIAPALFKTLDIFIVVSGIMTGYRMLATVNREKLSKLLDGRFILISFIVRYLRLAPLAVLILAFMKSLYPFLSEGPMWDYGTYKFSLQGQCKRSSWWRTLLLPILFGYKGDTYTNPCLPVSWYIVVDMKMALVAPIFLYLVTKYHNKSIWFMMAVIMTSFLSQYHAFNRQKLIYFQQFFTNSFFSSTNILSLIFGESSYYSVINRFHAFAIGLYAGVHLLYYRDGIRRTPGGELEKFNWPWWMRGITFKSMILYEIYDLFTLIMTYSNYINYKTLPSEELIKLSMIIKPRIDAIIFAIITLRLTTDLAAKMMANTVVFYRLGKLAFGVFLVHGIVISYALSSNEKSRLDAFLIEVFILGAYIIFTSLLVSFVLYLFFELPMANLLNTMTKKISSKSSSPRSKESYIRNSDKKNKAV